MSKKIETIYKFLQAARRLIKNNKDIGKDEIMRFAELEFGKVSEFLKKQIDDLFKAKPKTEKKGDVVPIKKDVKYRSPDEFNNRKEYENYLDEVLGPPDDVFGSPLKDDLLKEFDKVKAKNVTPKEGIMATDEAADIVKKRTDDIATGDPTGKFREARKTWEKLLDELNEMGKRYEKNPRRPGGPLDPKIGIVRAAVREILHNNLKAGKINIPDAAEKEAIERYMANKDPIDIFRKTYGEDALEAIDGVADNLLEIDQAGGSYTDINKFLQDNKLFDFVPKKTYGYDESIVSANKILKQAEQDAKNKKILEDFDIDPDRKPNADGGIIGNLRLNRTGFDDGSKDPKMSRRKFMKIIGGLGAVPIVGKYFKLGSAVSSKVAPAVAPVVKEVPGYLGALIEVIRSKGTEAVTKLGNKITEYKGVVVEEQPGRIEVYKVGDSKKNSHEIIEGIEEVKDEGLETQKIVQGDDEYYGQTTKEGEKKFKEIASEIKTMVEDMDEATPYVRFDRTLGKEKMADGGIISNLSLNRTGFGIGSAPKGFKLAKKFKESPEYKKFIELLFIKASNMIRQGKGIFKDLDESQRIKQHDNLTKEVTNFQKTGELNEGVHQYFGMNPDHAYAKKLIEMEEANVAALEKSKEKIKNFKELQAFDPGGRKPNADGGLINILKL